MAELERRARARGEVVEEALEPREIGRQIRRKLDEQEPSRGPSGAS